MRKHKDSKVLFEALTNKGVSETMKVPGWMKAQKAEEADSAEAIAPEVSSLSLDEIPETTDDVENPYVAPPPKRSSRPDGYFSRVDEIPTPTVSISFTQMVVVLVVFLLLLGGAFWMGIRVGSPDGPAPQPAPLIGTLPTTPIVNPIQPGAGTPVPVDPNAPVLATSTTRDPNRYYLAIQLLNSSDEAAKAEAEQIKTFLATKGISVSIDTVNNRRTNKAHYMIWDLAGYPSSLNEAAKARIAHVETLGKEYFRLHKSYQFIGPFYLNGK